MNSSFFDNNKEIIKDIFEIDDESVDMLAVEVSRMTNRK